MGTYRISAEAAPTDVSVGDPITLKIALSGPDYLAETRLPPLGAQPALARDFKIPKERAAGEVSGRSKIFTQTVRPLRPDVREIPPIGLSYFDPAANAYKTVRTEPIPIQVKAARVVTALDAEGASAPAGPGRAGASIPSR